MICWLPVERALSTTFFISQGERNWPFLMLTGLPCEQTLRMKLVWRTRNAGVCITSTTLATSAKGVSSCTSVSTGTPIFSFTPCSTLSPASRPGPRKLSLEERFALSYDALKMKLTFRRLVSSLSLPAISWVSVSPSITQGPAMRKNGRSMPTWKWASCTGTSKRVAEDTRPGACPAASPCCPAGQRSGRGASLGDSVSHLALVVQHLEQRLARRFDAQLQARPALGIGQHHLGRLVVIFDGHAPL